LLEQLQFTPQFLRGNKTHDCNDNSQKKNNCYNAKPICLPELRLNGDFKTLPVSFQMPSSFSAVT
jgi:hypothetical protein